MAKIPPRQMVLVWDNGPDGRITGSRIRSAGPDTEETRKYPKSLGACVEGWMDDSELETPLGLFTKLAVIEGFASENAMREMLQQFAKVEGQRWAELLLWELDGRPDGEYPR